MSEAALSASGRRPRLDVDGVTPALNELTRMQKARGILRLVGFVLLTLLVIPVQWVFVKLKLPLRKSIPFRYHRIVARIMGMRVRVTGAIEGGGGVLVASNHISWLDIVSISTVGPISLIAKKQVDTWPFFGLLARLQETVYVERERRAKTAEQRDVIKDRLGQGDTIVLFPEGTSSDGNRVLPFKSALLSAAEGRIKDRKGGEKAIRVQPMSVAYTKIQGLPMNRDYRPFVAWYGDMDLIPHLLELFSLGAIDCEITVHPSMTVEQMGSRKALTVECERIISESLSRSLAGRG
ncbi:MAG: 1-acyl-sn-glycerol-3-phosphate acyltransferase [Alphaproteobacteria bacterium]|nr:1-acyl-sn-glycerol-3-phosphate acyltransferase [Alphaproteobacteria bacterium]